MFTNALNKLIRNRRAGMKSLLIKTISILGLTILSSTNLYAQVEERLEKSFDVGEHSTLRVNNINGSVKIITWAQDVIKVDALVVVDRQKDRDNIRVEMLQTSRGVSIETHYDKNKKNGRYQNSGKVEYVITVPSQTELSAIELVNGSLSIDGVKGEINAQLVNGSIKANGIASNGEFSSVNGSIKVRYDEIASSLSDINLETVNGSIKLHVPSTVDASVNAETMHGSIKTDFGLPVEKNMFSGRHLSGRIGNGDIKITMESVNGSVKLLEN